MADVQQILVEFVVDDAGLKPAEDRLEALGVIDKKTAAAFKATNAELQKRQQAMNATAKASQQSAAATKKSIDDVDKAVKTFTQDFVEGFQEGVQAELKAAGVSAEEFAAALKTGQTEVSKSTDSLRGRLRQLTQQMALMKLEGQDNTEEYKRLAQEAGNLKDAMADANQEVKNFGSDTGNIDGLISAAQGVAGAFAIGQGAIGLFGEEGEELQETLLKVNSAMAILQGLQQVQTVLQKESAAATILQTAGQKIYNVVIGESIGLMAAFRVALAATGVGLLILGISALVAALKSQQRETEDSIKSLQKLNAEFERDTQNLDDYVDSVKRNGEEQIAALENAGATDAQLRRERIKNSQEELKSIFEVEAQYRAQVSAARNLLQQVALGSTAFNQEQVEEAEKLIGAFESLKDRRIDIASEIRVATTENERQTREEVLQGIADTAAARLASTVKNSKAELDAAKASARAKAAVDINAAGQNAAEVLRIQAELNDQIRDLDRQFAQVRQQDRIAGIEAALIAEQQISQAINERQSQAEIDLQKRLIQEKANLDLLQEGLTQNQILEIKKRAQAEIAKLQKDFNKQAIIESHEDAISRNNAELSLIELTNKERLNLTIDNLFQQASIEIEQNKGKVDKIKEIERKRDADVKAARLASIQQEVEEEITLRQAVGGVDTRADEKLLAAQDQLRSAATEREKRAIEERLAVRRLTINEEIALIDKVANREKSNIDLRLEALNESFAEGLISYKNYDAQYKALTDKQAEITENAEQRKRDAVAKTVEAQRQATVRAIDQSVEYVQQVAGIFESFAQNAQAREQNSIDSQRQRIEDLRKDGKISEQESAARLKRLDEAERRLRVQQAIREKRLAIFNATIGIASGIAKTIANVGFPAAFPLIAIAAVLGAAQIAAIASRPIPQFRKGKKNSYQGPGVVGEAGAELIEKDGQLFVAPKKTIVWLGAKDKVFNPQETASMLEKTGLKAQNIEHLYNNESTSSVHIDYDKLGKAVGKNIPQFGLNVDSQGFTEWVRHAQSFEKYLNSRRGYK